MDPAITTPRRQAIMTEAIAIIAVIIGRLNAKGCDRNDLEQEMRLAIAGAIGRGIFDPHDAPPLPNYLTGIFTYVVARLLDKQERERRRIEEFASRIRERLREASDRSDPAAEGEVADDVRLRMSWVRRACRTPVDHRIIDGELAEHSRADIAAECGITANYYRQLRHRIFERAREICRLEYPPGGAE